MKFKTIHYDEIDGLRGFAILFVLIFHFDGELLPFGYLGVDIFFVISGFVIASSVAGKIKDNCFSLSLFYMSRFKRLFPAMFAMVLVSTFASTLLLPSNTPILTGAAAFFGLSNIALWFGGQNYFTPASELNPLTHTWSLGVEEQFYVFLPCMLILFFKHQRAQLIVFLVMALTSGMLFLLLWDTHHNSAFYLLPFRFWELLSGVLIYIIKNRIQKTNIGLSYTALLLILPITCFGVSNGAISAIICVALTSCVLLSLGNGSQQNHSNMLLNNPIALALGRISYSLYLWHWPIVVFTKLFLPSSYLAYVYFSLTGILSLTSYFYIEKHFRYKRWSLFDDSVCKIILAAAIVCVVISYLRVNSHKDSSIGPKSMLEQSFLEKLNCHIPGENGLDECLKKQSEDKITIWLVGDSHAGNHIQALQKETTLNNYNFGYVTGRTLFFSLTNQCNQKPCLEGTHLDLVDHLSAVGKRGDFVFISFASDRFKNSKVNEIFKQQFSFFVKSLEQHELQVVLIEDIPKVCLTHADYLASAFRQNACSKSAEDSRSYRRNLSSIYKSVQDVTNALIVDPHDYFCEASSNGELKCSNLLKSKRLYIDSSPHLSLSANHILEKFYKEKMFAVITKKPK